MSELIPSDSHCEYDAFLFFTYGGPESLAEVDPFLDHILAGKQIPPGRREKVREHYVFFHGKSPINAHCRKLLNTLRTAFSAHHIPLPLYWSCRHCAPFLKDTLQEMAKARRKRPLVFVPSPFGGYFSESVYQNILQETENDLFPKFGTNTPHAEKIPPFSDNEDFLQAHHATLSETILRWHSCLRVQAPVTDLSSLAVLFTAHSTPHSSPDTKRYSQEVETCAKAICAQGISTNIPGIRDLKLHWNKNAFLTWQSAAGRPGTWLEPNISETLTELAHQKKKIIFLVPLGFPLDNMEVAYDLDTETARLAENLEISLHRTPTVGHHPLFIQMILKIVKKYLFKSPDFP
ncbi:MAG: ferrochelatase [Planctomycetia bacterium]|nr:ferrochelatase [Planctomycetia bacterium]